MVRSVALCAGLVVYALGWTLGEAAVALSPCPRPSDQYGPRYEAVSGAYQSRAVSRGGGKSVTITPSGGAAPISVNVTGKVFKAVGSLKIGARMTLLGYVTHSLSGLRPPYSCIELFR